MKKLTCADFAAQLNTKFTAHIRDANPDAEVAAIDVELELVKADDRTNDQCERFSLMFTGPKEGAFKQGSYPMKNEALGERDIFLVPVGEDEEGKSVRYQAVYNRLKGEE